MSYLLELFGQVWSSLARNKMRSLLTMAGIAWGVASIVLIVAMGDGFKEGQRKNTKSLGENMVIVWGGRTEKQAGGERAGRRIRLTYDDIRAIRAECYEVIRATPELIGEVKAASPYNSGTFEASGVEPSFFEVRTVPLAAGRHFTWQEEEAGERVCILGGNVRKQLFAARTGLVGQEIRINGIPFRIAGLMADKNQNSSYSGRDESKIFIPYRTMERDTPPKDPTWQPGILSNLIYSPAAIQNWEGAQKQVRRAIGRNHRFDPTDDAAIRMWDTLESAQLVDGIFQSMTAFLGVIALITLTLGGVGVMNIMLVTVTERTREIGIRKALGATRRRILFDFLVEGVLLAVISGGAGWLFSWGLASIVNSFPMPDMFSGLPVKGSTTAAAFVALGVIAIASALWPAWRASRLTPVEALRFER